MARSMPLPRAHAALLGSTARSHCSAAPLSTAHSGRAARPSHPAGPSPSSSTLVALRFRPCAFPSVRPQTVRRHGFTQYRTKPTSDEFVRMRTNASAAPFRVTSYRSNKDISTCFKEGFDSRAHPGGDIDKEARTWPLVVRSASASPPPLGWSLGLRGVQLEAQPRRGGVLADEGSAGAHAALLSERDGDDPAPPASLPRRL